MRQVLRRFLIYLETLGCHSDCRQNLPRLRKYGPREVVATPEERNNLINHAPPWMRCFLMLCNFCALRFNEAMSVSPRSYDREHQTITVRTKGSQKHTLPVPPELAALFELAPNPEDTETPYVIKLRGKPCNGCNIRVAFRALKKKLGVNPDLRPHDLRRTAANALYDLTHDVRAVQQLLGHNDLSSTAWYLAHRDPEKLRPLLAELSRWQHIKKDKEEPIQ